MSDRVIVLYRVSNSCSDTSGSSLYNAFAMPRSVGITLTSVKQHCRGLPGGSVHGYHWRVRVDDRSSPTSGGGPGFTWWDIQDAEARLPVREATFSELNQILAAHPSSTHTAAPDHIADVAKGAMRTLGNIGKAMNKVAASVAESSPASAASEFDQGPRIPIIVFKLVDTLLIQRDLALKFGTTVSMHMQPAPVKLKYAQPINNAHFNAAQPAVALSQKTPVRNHSYSSSRQGSTVAAAAATVATANAPSIAHSSSFLQDTLIPTTTTTTTIPNSASSVNLMDFGPTTTATATIHVPTSASIIPNSRLATKETPAQRLKREYEEKAKKENRIWDEVDQRWVTVPTSSSSSASSRPVSRQSSSSMGDEITIHNTSSAAKVAPISLDDTSNAIGKSAVVAAAVHARVSELKVTQQRAVDEVRAREQAKKEMENEEDAIRARLEPLIKQWAEEHGKKKQLRALLASLHVVLWPEAQWKPVGLGDLLDDKKCKLYFHKASRVVHPDKTMDMSVEHRFLAKRIFDALSQAKAEYDDGKK